MKLQSHKRNLILASSSPYRKILLERLGIPFQVYSPDTDETPRPGEDASRLATRLANDKAASLARQYPRAVVIGSDQVAVSDDEIIGKPLSASNAASQLRRFSGRNVQFLTAVSVLCEEIAFKFERLVLTEICFRQLSTDEIYRYIERDQPLDCAGSFRSEAAGISLLSAMESSDPTAIVGLPLISVAEALRLVGFDVP